MKEVVCEFYTREHIQKKGECIQSILYTIFKINFFLLIYLLIYLFVSVFYIIKILFTNQLFCLESSFILPVLFYFLQHLPVGIVSP